MFPLNLRYTQPHEDIYTNIAHADANSPFSSRLARDTLSPLFYTASRNINNSARMLYRVAPTWTTPIFHLIQHASKTPEGNKLPIITGTSIKVTHADYNNQTPILEILLNAGADLPPTLPYHAQELCNEHNPRIHLIFVHSGISILRTIIQNNPDLERVSTLEDIITVYTTNNTQVNRGIFNCIVLKNLFPENPTHYTDTYTIFVDYVDSIVLESLVLVSSVISQALITSETPLNSVLQQANILATESTEIASTVNLTTIYKGILTALSNELMTTAQTQLNTPDKENATAQICTKYLNLFYNILIKTYKDTSKNEFIAQFCKTYNRFLLGKDKEIIDNYPRQIREHYERIQQLQLELHNAQLHYAVATPYTEENVQQFFTALKLFKNITIRQSTQNYLILKIISPLNFFDDKDTKTIFQNSFSEANRIINQFANDNNLNKYILQSAIYDIFLRRYYTIYTFSLIRVQLNYATNYNPSSPIDLAAVSNHPSYQNELIAHPHIAKYDCWSSAKTEAKKAFMEQNFDNAFAQIIGATQNLTVADTTVLGHLLRTLILHWELKTLKITDTEDTFTSLKDVYFNKLKETNNNSNTENDKEEKEDE